MENYMKILATFIIAITCTVVCGKECTDINYCVEGQKCDGDTCVPCEKGTFQIEKSHQREECTPWAKKPSSSHWVIKIQGTAERDQVWGCADGYKVFQLTPQEQRCREIPTSSSSTTASTVPAKLNTSTPTPTSTNTKKSSSGLSTRTILLLVLLIVLIVFVAIGIPVIAIIVICKRRKKKGTKNREKIDEESHPLKNSSCKQALDLLADYLTENLTQESMDKLFMRLPSRNFYPNNSITYKPDRSLRSYREIFIEWREKNPDVGLEKITDILIDIGQTEITEKEDYKNRIANLLKEERAAASQENGTMETS
ncbi:hypothetical protein EGW08_019711 [Elysia chlorotica]|uniref:TNFR-Cys domain-containing protein n=1 Tax=Elysia chlorotica TaxID=188477 RepID=A0A433STD7_ELYCH|nr:hypothetical protein EGW08_019711 [Elysia chlorotica]